jgi:hypothetical protein
LKPQNQLLFAVLGACTGLIITFSLRGQGIAFAKREDESVEVMKAYHEALNKSKKEKQLKDISHYLFWSTIKDIVVKGISVGVSTYFILYIFMQGNGDWSLIGLALANLFMFSGFGLVALSKTYDKYIEEHIPVIRERTKKILAQHNAPKITKENVIDKLEEYDNKIDKAFAEVSTIINGEDYETRSDMNE